MARAALEIGVRELATMAGVSAMTVTRFENSKSAGYPDTLQKLRSALEAAGVIFIDENGQGPGVRLRKVKPDEGKRPDQLTSENNG
jgi:transcriptional regulator with XRE-family HTH domain